MQYFRTGGRRGACGCPSPASDIFPLCRGDKNGVTQAEAPASPRSCGCGNQTWSCNDVKTPTSGEFGCTGLAMAFVPDSDFDELNSPEEALCRGSLFRMLDMPFMGQKRRGCK